MEVLDLYNINKEKTGKIIERKEEVSIKENEYVLAVQCWIINTKKEIATVYDVPDAITTFWNELTPIKVFSLDAVAREVLTLSVPDILTSTRLGFWFWDAFPEPPEFSPDVPEFPPSDPPVLFPPSEPEDSEPPP